MSSRHAKIEARKRGAASRQLSSSQLVLGSPKTPMRSNSRSKPTTPRNLTQLESALNDHFETASRDNTPSHTPRESVRSTATTPRNLNILQSVFNANTTLSGRRQVKSPRPTYIPPERTPKRASVHHGKENISPIDDVVASKTPTLRKSKKPERVAVKRRTPLVKKRKSIVSKTPKKIVSKTKSIPVATPKKTGTKRKSMALSTPDLRKSKRPHKPLPKLNYSDVEEEPDISDFDSDYHSDDHNEPSVAPTPISKPKKQVAKKKAPLKQKSKQRVKPKMIEVKLERLSYTPKNSVTKNISTLDVLGQIMSEYLLASQPTRSSQLDRKVLKSYSGLVTDHFTKLIDHTLNNENLSKELINSNKQKENLRNKIYEIRKKHDELAVNLEKARRQYHLKKKKYQSNMKIETSLKKLKGNDYVDEDEVIDGEKNSMLDKVWMDIIKLDKVTNAKMGILSKFENLNNRLSQLDDKP